jgi:hypothetical protein
VRWRSNPQRPVGDVGRHFDESRPEKEAASTIEARHEAARILPESG